MVVLFSAKRAVPFLLTQKSGLSLESVLLVIMAGIYLALPVQAATFEIIALPDTQYYSASYPDIFNAQTQWIVDNQAAENIVFTTHLGDIVDVGVSIPQWNNALTAMNRLNGVVPYSSCFGNHDLFWDATNGRGVNNCRNLFGDPTHQGGETYYDNFDSLCFAQTFSAGGYDFLHLNLYWNPSTNALAWAQSVIDNNPGKSVILTTHEYLGLNCCRSGIGDMIWNNFVKYNSQIFLVLCGHYSTYNGVAARQLSYDDDARGVLQVLSDYQSMQYGGDGYLRKMMFNIGDDGKGTLSFQTYSPTSATPYLTDYQNQFSYPIIFTSSLHIATAQKTWRGGSDNQWDCYNPSSAWQEGNHTYKDGDQVLFNDTATGTTVFVTQTVKPLTMVVNNPGRDYIINSSPDGQSGKISGDVTLEKKGAGKLTLTGVNDYTGGTKLSNGSIAISGSANLGDESGVLTIGAATLEAAGTFVSARPIVLNDAASTILVDPGVVFAQQGVVSGTGALLKQGSGILHLSGENTYSGQTNINMGTLMVGNGAALGDEISGTTVADGATLDINAINLGAEAITVQGEGVSGNGAIVNNSSVDQQYALRFVAFSGNTTFGGVSRWDLRTDDPINMPASLSGNGYTLTKAGTNSVFLVNLGDTGLGDINIVNGELGVQGTTNLGDPAKTITVTSGGALTMWELSPGNVIDKKLTLQGGALQTANGAGSANAYGGEITLTTGFSGSGGTLNTALGTSMTISGNIVGTAGLSKCGGGIAILTGSANSWTGGTAIMEGDLQIGPGGILPENGPILISYQTYGADNWNGRLVYNSALDITISGNISGSNAATYNSSSSPGGILLANMGTLTLSGDNRAYCGLITIDSGNLRLSNSNTLGDSTTVNISGGGAAGTLKIDSGGALTSGATVVLAGRVTADTPHIINVSGNNSLSGIISLVEGGDQHVIQADAGLLTISGNVQNNADAPFTNPRNLVLQGAGYGEVTGTIGGGANPGVINLVKNGSGTWTIKSATNTYIGHTIINEGLLALDSQGSISASPVIEVQDNGIFDVSSFAAGGYVLGGSAPQKLQGTGMATGTLTIGAGGIVSPGGDGTVNILNIQHLTLSATSGGKVNFDLSETSSGPHDLLNVTGDLALPGSSSPTSTTFDFNLLNGKLTEGAYKLITYGGACTGGVENVGLFGVDTGELVTRQTFTLSHNSPQKEIELVVAGKAEHITWTGRHGGVWDRGPGGAGNWTITGADEQNFYDLDYVTFDDSGAVSPLVEITGAWCLGSVTVNASANYTFVGAGGINGGGFVSLSKSGTGTLIIANSGVNNYGGVTNIVQGTLQIGDGLIAGAGTIGTGNVVNEGTLAINRPDDFLLANVLSGAGNLVKQGAGKLTITGNNSGLTGSVTISGGSIVMGAAQALGSTAVSSPVAIENGAVLDINGYSLGLHTMSACGAGPVGAAYEGALINTGTENQFAVSAFTMTGPTVVGGSGRFDFYGSFNGGGFDLIKEGPNEIVIKSNGDTNLGNITINEGALSIQNNTTLSGEAGKNVTVHSACNLGFWAITSPFARNIVVYNGAVLKSGGDVNTVNGSITVNGEVTMQASTNLILGGDITGPGKIIKNNGPGVVILTGTANNWEGGTLIEGGELRIGDGGLSGSLPASGTITLNNSSVLNFCTGRTLTVSNRITGSGGISQTGSGTIILCGSNDYAGATYIAGSGALRFTGAQALGLTGSLLIEGFNSTGRLELDGSTSAFSMALPITLSGRQTGITEPHLINLGGNNTVNVDISDTAGGNQYIIQSNADVLSLASIAITNNLSAPRNLRLQGDGDGEVLCAIGAGSPDDHIQLTKDGSGTWTLTASNTYTEATKIISGTLILDAAGQISQSAVVDNNGTLKILAGEHALHDVSGGGETIIEAGASVTVDNLCQGRLSIGPDARLVFNPTYEHPPEEGDEGDYFLPVPEPPSLTLLTVAGAGMLLDRALKRRRKKCYAEA